MDATDRYLALLKNALLNEIYIENDVRLLYAFAMSETRQTIDMDVFRNVSARIPDWVERVRSARQDGRPWWALDVRKPDGTVAKVNLRNNCEFAHTMAGRARLDNIQYCVSVVVREEIPGDLAETGAWRGGASIFMKGCLAAWEIKGRTVWVADSFEGLPVPSLPQDAGHDFSPTKFPILAVSLDEVRENFRRYDLLDEEVQFLKGWFKDTLPTAPIKRLSILRLDGDLYESTMDALNALYGKVSVGGFVIVDDYYDFEPCRRAISEFRDKFKITDPVVPIDWSACYWRKSTVI